MPTSFAEVILDNSIEEALDYAIPSEMEHLKIGMRVLVPLRGKTAKGTILALKNHSSFSQVKFLCQPLGEEPLVCPELFKLATWIARYYSAPLSKVLKTILIPSIRDEKSKHKIQSFVKPLLSQEKMRALCEESRLKHAAQAKVLDALLEHPKGLFLTEILEKTAVSQSPIKTLQAAGVLQIQEVRIDRSPIFDHEFFPTKPKTLNPEQKQTLEAIVSTCDTFQTHLIHGVTGSGKTEVYLQAIDHVLKQGKGIIYLVPEIALTSQTIERFKGRFGGEKIAILHHRLSSGERFDAWHKIRSRQATIVIGARSAIFSPVPHLGMIIVDEEHESSYKQSDETPKYNARDVAVLRGQLTKCPVVLGSATPSLESYFNAVNGKYQLHRLLHRADKAVLPDVKVVDMRHEFEKNKGFTLFSDHLLTGIKKRLEKGEQTLLFLNRRGYHTAAQCPLCSYVVGCPHCELSLTYHLGEKILACHLCDFRQIPPSSCPECHADGPLKFKGAGTEMVERALHALFPTIRTLRLDADTTRHKGSHEKIFKEFRSGKADVLIGTQMIAKGLHFPLVTLVGVIGLDGSLNIPDFRASENVFQLLTQVAGRAGRGDLRGEVVIQTQLPEHPIIAHAAKQDFEAFYDEEIQVRELFAFPPYTHLIKFSFSGSDQALCEKQAKEFRQLLIDRLPSNVEIHPAVPCGYAKIKGKYRFQCLIKVEKIQNVLSAVQTLRAQFGKKGDIRLAVDVDPLTTYF
ncbi:MAG: primosomal protein N' [Verrucomicrobia bacterium]|nr:primosomal protein N' [Verrucomicrobiota bacterium]